MPHLFLSIPWPRSLGDLAVSGDRLIEAAGRPRTDAPGGQSRWFGTTLHGGASKAPSRRSKRFACVLTGSDRRSLTCFTLIVRSLAQCSLSAWRLRRRRTQKTKTRPRTMGRLASRGAIRPMSKSRPPRPALLDRERMTAGPRTRRATAKRSPRHRQAVTITDRPGTGTDALRRPSRSSGMTLH